MIQKEKSKFIKMNYAHKTSMHIKKITSVVSWQILLTACGHHPLQIFFE